MVTDDVDDHPLAFMVDAVREAGMVQVQTEIAAALPEVSTAIDHTDGGWWIHVTWIDADAADRWLHLYWDPERAFEVAADRDRETVRRFQLPADAIAAVVELVRGQS